MDDKFTGSKEAQMKEITHKLAGEYYKDRNLNFNTVLYGTWMINLQDQKHF